MTLAAYRVHAKGITVDRVAVATPDFTQYLLGNVSAILTRLVAQFEAAGVVGRWFAFIGLPLNPDDLADSSQGDSLPSWSPQLVNGQPMRQGDQLSIVAFDAPAGSVIHVSAYLTLESGP